MRGFGWLMFGTALVWACGGDDKEVAQDSGDPCQEGYVYGDDGICRPVSYTHLTLPTTPYV